jgi:hypothetical protein
VSPTQVAAERRHASDTFAATPLRNDADSHTASDLERGVKYARSMKITTIASSLLLALGIAACDSGPDVLEPDEDLASAESALTTPTVEELVNTCDQNTVKLVTSGSSFVLDPGNGSQTFKGTLSSTKLACSVGVKFDVPAGYRARLGIGTTYGSWWTNSTSSGTVFTDQAGFTTLRPLLAQDTQAGPSATATKFLPKSSSGPLDLQVSGTDAAFAGVVTACGAQNVWFYVRPKLDSSVASTTLSVIHGSFKLEPCP